MAAPYYAHAVGEGCRALAMVFFIFMAAMVATAAYGIWMVFA
jgi:hypothetical protein